MKADDMISIARAEALFVSPVSVSDRLTRQQVTALVGRAVRAHHGVRGYAAEFAAAYAEHPDIAPARMRWARTVVDALYPVRRAHARVRAGRPAHDLAGSAAACTVAPTPDRNSQGEKTCTSSPA